MKNTTLKSKLLHTAVALLLTGLMAIPFDSSGQQMVRKYASRQAYEISGLAVGSSTSNRALAVDTDPQTSANMTVGAGLLASTSFYLDFNPDPTANSTYAATIPANTPITIKFTAPAGLLSLGSGIEVQAITNLSRNGSGQEVGHTNVGTAVSGAALLALLSGEGQQELTLTPSAAYQGIRITLNGGLIGVAIGTDVFGAYIMEPATGNINCDDRIDVLYGVTSNSLANLATGLGSINNPLHVMDGDATTFAQMNMGAEVLNATYINTVFNSLSKEGDEISLIIQDATASLLTVGLLTNFQIRLYNGPTLTKTITNDPSLLSLTLLQGASNIYTLTARIDDAVFDRAEVIFGGAASALDGLRIYEVNRKAATPTLTAAEEDIYVYEGQSATLSATPGAAGDLVGWYDAVEGGNTVTNPYPTSLGDGGTTVDVFATAIRNGCNENSDFVAAHIHIIGFDTETPADGTINTPYNGSVAVTNVTTTPNPGNYAYTIVSGTLPDGITMSPTTGELNGDPTTVGTFTFEVLITDTGNGGIEVGTFTHVINIDMPLPITGNQLQATLEKGAVILAWTTYSEQNNEGFAIERSADGRSFAAVGKVGTQAPDGNSADKLQYQFADKLPLAGHNYYRVKQSDFDGKTSYSNVVLINVASPDEIRIFPNPAKDQVSISGKHIDRVIVYNLLGQRVLDTRVTDQVLQLNTTQLPAGSYSLQVITAEGSSAHKLIIR